MLRIVPHTVPRVGRSYEHFPDGFELHLLQFQVSAYVGSSKKLKDLKDADASGVPAGADRAALCSLEPPQK